MARRILQPPRLRTGDAGERHATWMELFFDLVFVVAISQLAERLAARATAMGALAFLLLFVPVWWAWVGATFYVDRFGADALIDRLFLLAQMAAGAGMAISAGAAFGDRSADFALSYAAFRFVLVARYGMVGRYVPEAGPFTSFIARGFALGATLWLVSAFVPPPERFFFWGIGMVTDLATPIAAGRLESELPPHPRHLPERFGLFALIVLGDAIAETVEALHGLRLDWSDGVSALLALVLAFAFWWTYFEGMDAAAIRRTLRTGRLASYELWIYAHLPLTVAITASGVGVRHTILAEALAALPTADRWLICAAVSLCFASLGTIYLAQASVASRRCTPRETAALWAAAVAVLLIGTLGTRLTPLGLLTLLAAVGVFQIFVDLAGRAARSGPGRAADAS
ncbi:MAG TPA: low temperature requirement protein A [Longimicrobiales bacterium]